jgi:hypothetical protein
LIAGGCSAFGHSCFGGHGKRADEGLLLVPGADSDQQQQRLVFPAGSDGEDALSPASSSSLVASAHRFSPFLRQWVSIAWRDLIFIPLAV